MPIHPWPHLLKRIPKGFVVLGLDIGEKTIGLAISDPLFIQATPLTVLTRSKLENDLTALAKIAEERQVGGFVLGLPINMDGSENPSTQRVRLLAKQLDEKAALFPRKPDISFYDERLSTAEAERMLIKEADLSRGKRDKVIDKLAAQIILQAALDNYQYGKNNAPSS